MKRFLIGVLALTISCSKPKPAGEGSVSDTTRADQPVAVRTPENYYPSTVLRDTVLNGHTLKFQKISEESFNSFLKVAHYTPEVRLVKADTYVNKVDSCFIVKLQNQSTDSLCNQDDGEYFEKYAIKGLWEKHRVLWISFENWEESHDFLLSTKDGSYLILGPHYEINPGEDKVLVYADIIEAPIYPGELEIKKIIDGTFRTIYEKQIDWLTISDAKWLSDSEFMIAAGFVDESGIKNKEWFRVTID